MNIQWIVEPNADDQDTKEIITLTVLPDDPTETITMQDENGNLIGKVRKDSIAHWSIIKRGGRVVRS